MTVFARNPWVAALAVPQPVRHHELSPGLHACDTCGTAVDVEADPTAIDPDDPQTVTCDLCRATWDTDNDWSAER